MRHLYKKQFLLFSLVAMALSVSFQLKASNVGFLKYSVITDFTESDMQKLQQEYLLVLKKNRPGDIHNWDNSKTKNGGEITVIKQYRQNESVCKRLKFKNKSKNQLSVSYFNFCLIDQQWKMVN